MQGSRFVEEWAFRFLMLSQPHCYDLVNDSVFCFLRSRFYSISSSGIIYLKKSKSQSSEWD